MYGVLRNLGCSEVTADKLDNLAHAALRLARRAIVDNRIGQPSDSSQPHWRAMPGK